MSPAPESSSDTGYDDTVNYITCGKVYIMSQDVIRTGLLIGCGKK